MTNFQDNSKAINNILTRFKQNNNEASIKYINKIRIYKINQELIQVTIDYETLIDTPIIYPVNGKTYKPKYAQESYMNIFQMEQLTKMTDPTKTIFPILIKDSTKLDENTVLMNSNDLLLLTIFLNNEVIKLWNIKAKKENDLLIEKNNILTL